MNHKGRSRRHQEIHLADLLRALDQLDWHGESEAEKIARCLGFGLGAQSLPSKTTEIFHHEVGEQSGRGFQMPSGYLRDELDERDGSIELPKNRLSSVLQPVGKLAASNFRLQMRRPRASNSGGTEVVQKVAKAGLLRREAGRHILSAAVAMERRGKEIDVPALVSHLSRLKPVKVLPVFIEATLENGCQLLLDYGKSMAPFFEDLSQLVRELQMVVGKPNVSTFSFVERPEKAIYRSRRNRPVSWRADGKPVLVATDFGVSLNEDRDAAASLWGDCILECERSHSPLVFLNPLSRKHWPTSLGGYPEIIHWSPRTTATDVVNVIGKGHRSVK